MGNRRIFLHWSFVFFLIFFTNIFFALTPSQVYAATQQDTQPPTSSATLLGTWNGFYFTSNVEVSIVAIDEPSGQSQDVKYTAYRINSGSWKPYTDPFLIQDEGTYSLSYFSEDYNGNPEQAKTTQFKIDYNAPSPTPEPTQIVVVTAAPTPTAAPTITQGSGGNISPSATPTKAPSTALQSYPASYPYYRSPTKTPTPTPSTVKKVSVNNVTTTQVTPKTPSATLTPTVRIVQKSDTANNDQEPAILGQWTKSKTNESKQQSNNPFIVILAFIVFGTYIFGVYYFYKKLKKKHP